MAQEMTVEKETSSDTKEGILRVYEIGYHIAPGVEGENVEKVVTSIRSSIEKVAGTFIAEGAPSLTRFAYPIPGIENGKKTEYDRGYFGWIKFEADSSAAAVLSQLLREHKDLLRSIVFETVRQDTRAHIKAPTLHEVKRTDTIKSAPRRVTPAEESAPVSEEDLEKALKDLTTE